MFRLIIVSIILFANNCLAESPNTGTAVLPAELYGYKYIKQLPNPELVKAGMSALEAMKILGKNTDESIYGGSIFPEDVKGNEGSSSKNAGTMYVGSFSCSMCRSAARSRRRTGRT